MQATIEFTQESQARWDATWRDLEQLAALGKREAALIADAGRRGVARNFEREESPDGTPWHPLAVFTQRERARLGFAAQHPILHRTGDLLRSFTEAGHPQHVYEKIDYHFGTLLLVGARDNPRTPGRIALLNAGGVTTGPLLGMPEQGRALERYMNRGGFARGYNVPARPFVGWSDAAVAQVDAQARAVVNQRVERAGR